MVGGANIAALLNPIDVRGPKRFIYSYVRDDGTDAVRRYLEHLRGKDKRRLAEYHVSFRSVGLKGTAPQHMWHLLEFDEISPMVPRSASSSMRGALGVFENRVDRSRIYHSVETDGLFVLLTVFTGRSQRMNREGIRPALLVREDYLRRKAEMAVQ